MTRPLRIEFKGAVYHITSRGNAKQAIFLDEKDFADFFVQVLQDFLGLDVVYHSSNYFAERLSKDYTPGPILTNLVNRNKLGKKTGEGIYKWPEFGRPKIDLSDPADFDLMDLMRVQINEAVKVFEEGIATLEDIDLGMKLNYNNPKGPFELARSIDLEELTRFLDNLAEKFEKKIFLAHGR